MREITNGKKPKNPWSFMQHSGEINPLKMIPIVEFNRATDRTGCFERQISDMNALWGDHVFQYVDQHRHKRDKHCHESGGRLPQYDGTDTLRPVG